MSNTTITLDVMIILNDALELISEEAVRGFQADSLCLQEAVEALLEDSLIKDMPQEEFLIHLHVLAEAWIRVNGEVEEDDTNPDD